MAVTFFNQPLCCGSTDLFRKERVSSCSTGDHPATHLSFLHSASFRKRSDAGWRNLLFPLIHTEARCAGDAMILFGEGGERQSMGRNPLPARTSVRLSRAYSARYSRPHLPALKPPGYWQSPLRGLKFAWFITLHQPKLSSHELDALPLYRCGLGIDALKCLLRAPQGFFYIRADV